MPISYDEILNSNPKKRLLIGYENLLKNYNETEAANYSELYKDQPLSFILENARQIMCEPLHGYGFYKNIITESANYCLFTELENQKEIVEDYLTENGDKMEAHQKAMYDELLSLITEKCEELYNTCIVAGALQEKTFNEKWTEKLSDALYESAKTGYTNTEDIDHLMESVDDVTTFCCYVPYMVNATGKCFDKNKTFKFFREFTESELNEPENFTTYVESAVLLSKLGADNKYREIVSHIRPMDVRFIFESMVDVNLGSFVEEITTEKVSDVATFYSTPFAAVNNIFEDNLLYQMNHEENVNEKNRRALMEKALYEAVHEFVGYEYTHYDKDASEIKGYGTLFEAGTTMEDAYHITSSYITEAEEATDEKEEGNSEPKKVNAPKASSLAEKIQIKAMDYEAKATARRAERKRKGQSIKNAAKAASAVPRADIKDLENDIKTLDDMDDERRIKFMTKPGFRKKFFKKLKLAILYGSAAQVKLAYVPLVAFLRHYSKMKDRRIRNSLFYDIRNEIKICEAKIQDADAAGDKDKKYELMRVKAALEKDAIRVANNSKYI